MKNKLNVLLTCMGGYGALTLLEDFKKSSISEKVNFIGSHNDPIFLARSPLKKNYLVPSALKNASEYIEKTKKIIGRESIDLIIPKSDSEVKAIYPVLDQLKCKKFLPDFREISATQDKLDFNKILVKNSIPAASTFAINSLDSIKGILEKIDKIENRYWLRIKTAGTAGAYGATWIKNEKDAIDWIESFCKKENVKVNDFTLSEYLPGRLFECLVLFRGGELKLAKIYENLRFATGGKPMNYGIGSTPDLAKTVDDEVSRAALENAVNAVKASSKECSTITNGIYHMSAKQNFKGIPCITEVNIGRTPSTISIFNRTGSYNVAEYFLNYALEEKIKDPEIIFDIPSTTFYAIRSLDQPLCLRSEEQMNSIKYL